LSVTDEQEISKIFAEESARGRRPKHAEEKEKRRRLEKLFLDSMRQGNRSACQQALIDFGEKPGAAGFEELMREYDEYQHAKRRL
jgi:hypothetical protein